MQHQTYLKNIDIAPKKIRFILPAVKRMKPTVAVDYLYYAKQKSARVLYKALQSAINNAKNTLKVDPNLLKFRVLTIEQGLRLKRYIAGSRGSAKPIVRRFSHIKIVLETNEAIDKPEVKSQTLKVKSTIKKSKV